MCRRDVAFRQLLLTQPCVQVTPALPCLHTSSTQLTLQDLWDWFVEPGLFGHRVETEGCRLGPSSAFFVPLLSAMRLFSCHPTEAAAARAQEDAPHLDSVEQCQCMCAPVLAIAPLRCPTTDAEGRRCARTTVQTCAAWAAGCCAPATLLQPGARAICSHCPQHCRYTGADDAPAQVQLLALHNNRKLPWERLPLHQEVEVLANQEPTTSVPCPHALGTTRLADVHPSSWLAVWWQPLYRIPEMPLETKFLVYYSFRGLLAGQRAQPALVHVPVAGMLCSAAPGPPGAGGALYEEQWAQVNARGPGGYFAAPREVHAAQQRANGMLRDLHAAAQQLTCDFDTGVRVVRPDGGDMEDEPHRDFTFLQRGRLGPGAHA